MKHTHIYKLFGISIVCSLFWASTLEANVVNTISVSSHSGGNTAGSGVVIEGKGESSVDIVTVMNGEVVEEVHETASSGSIYIENTVISNDGIATSETVVYTDDTQFEEARTVSLDSTEAQLKTNIISNLQEETDDESLSGTFKPYSLFATLFMHFSRTLNHVLSNLI